MKKNSLTISGAILSGGKNLRISGKNKAFLQMDRTPIIQKTINLFKEIFSEIILVTNQPEDYKQYRKDCIIVKDVVRGIGPLAGIATGLSQSSGESVFFVACDMPFLHNDMIRYELDVFQKTNCDAFVPRMGSFIEPLHAVYRKNLKDRIFSFIENSSDYSIRSFLQTVNTFYWDLEDNIFHRSIFSNINTPEELRKAQDLL